MSTTGMKRIPQTWDSPALSLVGLPSLRKRSQPRSPYRSKSSSNKTSRKEQETMKGTPLEGCFLPTLFIEENRNQNHNTRACLPRLYFLQWSLEKGLVIVSHSWLIQTGSTIQGATCHIRTFCCLAGWLCLTGPFHPDAQLASIASVLVRGWESTNSRENLLSKFSK